VAGSCGNWNKTPGCITCWQFYFTAYPTSLTPSPRQ
jgi:hypothetical protein